MAAHPTLTLAGRTFTASCLATAVYVPLDGGEPLQLIAGAWLPLRDPGEPARLPDFTDPVASARAWADATEAANKAIAQNRQLVLDNQAQADALAVAAPKAQALELITANDESLTLTQAAKVPHVVRPPVADSQRAQHRSPVAAAECPFNLSSISAATRRAYFSLAGVGANGLSGR